MQSLMEMKGSFWVKGKEVQLDLKGKKMRKKGEANLNKRKGGLA